MEVRLHPLAVRELREAVLYYEDQQKGLGKALRNEAKASIEGLKTFPHRAARIVGPFRRFLLHQFPYGIIYSAEGPLLFIIAIAHLSRVPAYWHDRVSQGE